jgi:putative aldouronate transport system substrate-binding protein
MMVLTLGAYLYACGGSESKNQAAGGTQKVDELVWAYFSWGQVLPDTSKVQDAINAYLAEKLPGIKVKMTPMGFGDYMQKIPLMLASPNEALDLMSVHVLAQMPLDTWIQAGQVLPIDDLIVKYGQGIINAVGNDYLDVIKKNGNLWGVPTIRDFAGSYGVIITKDAVKKYSLDLSTIKSIEDMTPLLAKIKAQEPNLAPLALTTSAKDVTMSMITDSLGDYYGVLLGNSRKVENLYENPLYKQRLELFRSWYRAGYIARDAAAKQEGQQEQLRAGTAVMHFTAAKPGVEIEEAAASGHELDIVRWDTPLSTTNNIAGVQWIIPNNARYPEKSMQFLNLLYTDPVLANLFNYGIEGVHYVKNSNGTIRYPDGVDAATSLYAFDMPFQVGNQFLLYLWDGSPLDLWQQLKDFNKSARLSPAMGFSFDNASVQTELAAVNSVANQYLTGLETGSVDISVLDEFNARLKQAGLDKIIAEKQRQLDAWFKASGK